MSIWRRGQSVPSSLSILVDEHEYPRLRIEHWMVADHLVKPIIGCFGYPIAGNPTQYVTELAIRTLGLEWTVLTASVRPSQLGAAIAGAQAMRFRGLAFLPPYDREAIQFFPNHSPIAARTGVIQVACRDGEEWIGHDLTLNVLKEQLHRIGVSGQSGILFSQKALLQDQLHEYCPEWSDCIVKPVQSDPSAIRDLMLDNSMSASPEQRPVNVLIHMESESDDPEALLQGLPRQETGTILQMHPSDLPSTWRQWAQEHGWNCLGPLDYRAALASQMFLTWTGTPAPISIIRDALDEYLEW